MSFFTAAPADEKQAIEWQRRWRESVKVCDVPVNPRFVAGVDVSYAVGSDRYVAAAVVFDLDSLMMVESVTVPGRSRFPYVPGLLAFREAPAVLDVLGRLRCDVGLVVCDGHGRAHPRGFGLACHVGVSSGIPTIGVAKNAPQFPTINPKSERGSFTQIWDGDDLVGRVLRTQHNVKPVYVSCGQRMGLTEACDVILRLTPRFRLPETTRASDQLSRRVLAGSSQPID